MMEDIQVKSKVFSMFVDMSRIVDDICAWIVYEDSEMIDSGIFRRAEFDYQNKQIIERVANKYGISYESIRIDK